MPQGRSGRVRKISPLYGDSIPGPSSPSRVAIPTELSRLPFMEKEGLIISSSAIKGMALQNTTGPVCVVKVGI